MGNYVERIQKENDEYAKQLQELKDQIKIAEEALLEASEYARCDDVNGEAGSICESALKKLGWS